MPKRDYYIIAVLLFSLFLLQSISSMALKSAAGDEAFYLSSSRQLIEGSHWSTWPDTIHAPLTYYIYGFLLRPFEFQDDTMKLFWARLIMLIFGLFLGLVVLRWTRELFGDVASLFALTLYVLSPTVLAYARFITHDVAFSALAVTSFYCFWRFTVRRSKRQLVLSAVLCGLALAAHLGAIILLAIYAVLFFLFFLSCLGQRSGPAAAGYGTFFLKTAVRCILYFGMTAAIALVILNAAYLFNGSFRLERTNIWMSPFFVTLSRNTFGRALLFPFPEPYLVGLDFRRYFSAYGFPAFLLGGYSISGRWYFFPLLFLIKTPIPLLVLTALSILLRLWRPRSFIAGRNSWVPGAVCACYVVYACLLNNCDAGLRHILIVYPLLFILVAEMAGRLIRSGAPSRVSILAFFLWYAADSVLIYPHYLAFVNAFAGGPENGYRCVIDSNFEWGQDAAAAEDVVVNSEGKVVVAPPFPTTGRIVISATRLNDYMSPRPRYGWLRGLEPVGKIGYTWLVFDIDPDTVRLRLKENPHNLDLYYALAVIAMEEDRLEEAGRAIEDAKRLDDSYPDIYVASGLLAMRLGQTERAKEEFRKAVLCDTELAEADEHLAFLIEVEGDRAGADRATKEMLFGRAKRSHAREMPSNPAYYERRISLNDADFKACNNLGFLLWANDRCEEATQLFDRAIAINPRYIDAYANLSYLLEERGDLDKALEVRRAYIALLNAADSFQEPRVFYDDEVIMCNDSFVIQQLPIDDELRYEELLKKKIALESDPGNVELCHDIALDYMWLGRNAIALRYARRCIEIDPRFLQAYISATVLFGEKKLPASVREEWLRSIQTDITQDVSN
ncbi:MAG: glycosyltransferase family 39 protein [Candidatus Omnitrophica bacterium]|nr:glycosyltransferase family 39 protein [Candidatus Omnitrophota bacterium]